MPWIRRLGRPVTSTPTLRMLLLPRQRWAEAPGDAAPGSHPAYEELFEHMATAGVALDLAPVSRWPWNPFAGRHAVLEGIDPLRALRILLFHRDHDGVVCFYESPALVLVLLRRLLFWRRPVAILDIGLSRGWRLRDAILRLVIPRLDGIAVLGTNQIAAVHRRWRTGADVTFTPQHVDTGFFSPRPITGPGTVLTVGDDAGRDFATLLRAAEGLEIALVARTGMITEAEVAGRPVRLVRGRLSWTEYRALFEAARIVVVPLRPMETASGIGTLLEAMAMGRAVIVSASPGIMDYVRHEETALVVPCGDAAALRAAILRLQADPALADRLGRAARSWVEANCSYRVVGQCLAAWLRRLAQRG